MKKEMLINVLQPEECRIAIIEDGVLEELYVERTSHESYVGNIYKGRIVNIEPSIQAAFVDFGVGRNGFLHVSDVEPAYYRHLMEPRRQEEGGRREHGGRGRPPRGGRGPNEGGRDMGRSRNMRDRPPRYPEEHVEREARAPREEMDQDLPPEASPVRPPVAEGPVADLSAGSREATPAEETLAVEPADAVEDTEGQAEATLQTETEPGKPRRRPRGRPRRPKPDEAPDEGAEASGEPSLPAAPASEVGHRGAPAAEPGPEVEERERKRPEAPERPRFMDSAERRTKEDDTDLGPLEPRPEPEDAELSFRRPEPGNSTAALGADEEEEDLDEGPDDLFEEEEAPAEREEPDVFLEEDLEEDLPEDRLSDLDEEEPSRGPRRRDDRHGGRRPGGPGNRRGPGRPGMGRPKPLIQDIFKRGQEVLVQVIKEGIGTKGPTLSTYISIAGRYLVLMPGLNRIGVSRKITDEEQRRRLREILSELEPPKGLGFIIRTAGLDRTKKELQRDLAYLSRLWQVVVRRIRKLKAPAEIYQESDMITRTIRDTFTSEIDTIWVDETAAFEHAQEFLTIVMPRYANRINHYADSEPMFHKYGIESEIARIQQKHVPLPNGGSIVIEQTEALVAIDVNSGNFRADRQDAEETAYQMNLSAAREIARQLRLRDLGGVIVNDFIDMRDEKHRRGVEKGLRDAVKRDRARTKILKISAFGIIEMTRQRIRPSLKRSIYQDCPACRGQGQVKTCESMSIEVMRMLQLAAHRESIHRIQVRVQEEVSHYLLNRKRKDIARLEETSRTQVVVHGVSEVPPEFLEFTCYDNNNNEVKFLTHDEPRPRRR